VEIQVALLRFKLPAQLVQVVALTRHVAHVALHYVQTEPTVK
jgi:hypothetical protein